MNKTEIRIKTKKLAKVTLKPILFKLIFIFILEIITINTVASLLVATKSKWFEKAVVTFLHYDFNYIEIILSILFGILIIPLSLGIYEYLLNAVRLKRPKLSDVFLWFSESTKLKIVLNYFLWTASYSIITLPINKLAADFVIGQYDVIMTDFIQQVNSGTQSITFNFRLINTTQLILSIALLLVSAIISIMFSLVPFIMIDNPKISGFKAALQSWKIMKGHVITYVMLILSFAGWFFASIFTMFLIAIYFYPYLRVSTTIFAEYVRAEKKLKEISPEDTFQ